jgi:hypothetical protein
MQVANLTGLAYNGGQIQCSQSSDFEIFLRSGLRNRLIRWTNLQVPERRRVVLHQLHSVRVRVSNAFEVPVNNVTTVRHGC